MCGSAVPVSAVTCPICGWGLQSSQEDALPIGTLLKQGRFRIEKLLGIGGFGLTYLVTDVTLNRVAAVKELFGQDWKRDGLLAQPSGRTSQSEFQEIKESFLQEGRALAQFSHPSIVKVYDQFSENNTVYLVMEYLQGESLIDRINREGSIPAEELVPIAKNLAQALKVIHASGTLHRDVKPDNIILERSGRTVLIDFGSAREFQANKTVAMTVILTHGYAPLEQYASKGRLGPPTDLYALGATLHHAITGHMPPSAADRANGSKLLPLPAVIPPGLKRAVEGAMQIPIAERPQNVSEFLALLSNTPLSTVQGLSNAKETGRHQSPQ